MNNQFFKLSFLLFLSYILTNCNSEKPTEINTDNSKESIRLEDERKKLEDEKLALDAEKKAIDEAKANQKKAYVKPDYEYLLGKWNGTLRDKKLTVVIESIDGSSVAGYNTAGKNNRPLIGRIYEDDRMGDGECSGDQSCYKLVLSEPGDDKWDGVFTLYLANCPNHDDEGNIIRGSYSSGNGKWKSNSGKLSGEISLSKN